MKWLVSWWRRRGWTVVVTFEDGEVKRFWFSSFPEALQFDVVAGTLPTIRCTELVAGRVK